MTTTDSFSAAATVRIPASESNRKIVSLASWLFLLACIVDVLPGPLPVMTRFQDDHWAAFLNLAFLAHRQFGTDVVFTYGAWGFLVHPRDVAGIYPWLIFGR